MINFSSRSKKTSDSSSVCEKIDYLLEVALTHQKSDAKLRQDIREIVREVIEAILDQRQRQSGVFAI